MDINTLIPVKNIPRGAHRVYWLSILNIICFSDFKQHSCTDFYTSGKRSGGTWSWRSTGQPFRYTEWGPGEPNDHGSSEDVLGIFQSDQHGYLWNDISPAAKLCFICEFN